MIVFNKNTITKSKKLISKLDLRSTTPPSLMQNTCIMATVHITNFVNCEVTPSEPMKGKIKSINPVTNDGAALVAYEIHSIFI